MILLKTQAKRAIAAAPRMTSARANPATRKNVPGVADESVQKRYPIKSVIRMPSDLAMDSAFASSTPNSLDVPVKCILRFSKLCRGIIDATEYVSVIGI